MLVPDSSSASANSWVNVWKAENTKEAGVATDYIFSHSLDIQHISTSW